jgi:hypothetical protein
MIDLLSRRDSGVWQGSVKVLFLIFIEKILDNVFWEWIIRILVVRFVFRLALPLLIPRRYR